MSVSLIQYLKNFKRQQGLYIIKPKSVELLKEICNKLNYPYQSDIAYIGKADMSTYSDLYKRSRQEMGWANFKAAIFMRKIGEYLDFDVNDYRNKSLRESTKKFICDNFEIECIVLDENNIVGDKEKEYISKYKPCMNVKNNKL